MNKKPVPNRLLLSVAGYVARETLE